MLQSFIELKILNHYGNPYYFKEIDAVGYDLKAYSFGMVIVFYAPTGKANLTLWSYHGPKRTILLTEDGGIIINFGDRIAEHLDWNVLRWFMIGSLTVSIDWVIFVGLYPYIHSVAVTNLISGASSTIFNYISHHRWTFKTDQHHLQSGPRYIVLLLGGYLLNTILVKTFLIAGLGPGLAKLLAAVILAPVSFFFLKFFVFKVKAVT